MPSKKEMEKVPGYILVQSRWVLCNKGDADSPDVRALGRRPGELIGAH